MDSDFTGQHWNYRMASHWQGSHVTTISVRNTQWPRNVFWKPFSFSVFFSSSLKAYRNYWNLYYQPPWSRVGPYAIGVIGAVFMQKFQREKRQIRPVFYLLGWIIAAVLCLAIMYGKIPMEKNVDKYLNSTRDVMYIMFDRIVWSLSVFFVLFACQTVIIPGQLTFICVRVAAVLLLRF